MTQSPSKVVAKLVLLSLPSVYSILCIFVLWIVHSKSTIKDDSYLNPWEMILAISLILQFWCALLFRAMWLNEVKLLTGVHRRIADGTFWVIIAGAIPYILIIGPM